MIKKIYVGNLPFRATENEVGEFFAQFGDVYSINLISDRETGRPRGFGFIELDLEDPAAAIGQMDGVEFWGRNLRVNEATERAKRPPARRREW